MGFLQTCGTHFKRQVGPIVRRALAPWKKPAPPPPPADLLIASLHQVEQQEGLPPAHFRELLDAVYRMVRRDEALPGAAELNRATELAAMTTADRLIWSLRQVEQHENLPSLHFQEVVQTVHRMAHRDETLPGAAELNRSAELEALPPAQLARGVELATLPPADRLITTLREVDQRDDLPPTHFEELAQTLFRMARQDETLPGAAKLNRAAELVAMPPAELARGVELAAMPPPNRLITTLREVDQRDGLPPTHFQELVQTVLRLARWDETLPGAAELNRAAELEAMPPSDRLILSLNQAEREGNLPPAHFQELAQAIFRLARQEGEREATLGALQISAAQDAIVRNLARTVIGTERFLVVDVGAHDGWFIDRILEVPRDIHVVAFEPMPEMRSELAKRQARWPGIEVFSQAVGDRPETLELKVYPTIPGLSSLLDFEKDYAYFKGNFDPGEFHTVEVPVITLDDHFRNHPHLADYPNVALKIDVQGFEDRVLRGAEELLGSGRVKAILIELVTRAKYGGSWDHLTLLSYLDRHGFVLYDVNPFYREIGMAFQPTATGRLTEMDCLFVRADYLEHTAATP